MKQAALTPSFLRNELIFRRLGSGWPALVAFVLGFGAMVPFMNTSWYGARRAGTRRRGPCLLRRLHRHRPALPRAEKGGQATWRGGRSARLGGDEGAEHLSHLDGGERARCVANSELNSLHAGVHSWHRSRPCPDALIGRERAEPAANRSAVVASIRCIIEVCGGWERPARPGPQRVPRRSAWRARGTRRTSAA